MGVSEPVDPIPITLSWGETEPTIVKTNVLLSRACGKNTAIKAGLLELGCA